MGDKWNTSKVCEIAEKVAMGPFGSSIKISTFVDKGIPVISGQHLRGTRLEDNEFNFVTLEHAEKLKNANVFRGDVIFTHAGNIGQVAYVPNTSKYNRYIISQRQFYMRCDKTKILPEFITYFFKTAEGQHKLLANTSQTGVPSIARPVSYLRTIEIPLPPLSEQKAIASILGVLDDKIELNRKTNETLETMARAIFKSCFTYPFEGLKYLLNSEAPSPQPSPSGRGCQELTSEGELALVDSPLGKIPKGWRVNSLNEIAELQRNSINPLNFPNEVFDHYSIPAFDEGQMPTRDLSSTIKSNKFLLPEKCILISKLNPRISRIWFSKINKTHRSVASTEFLVLIPKFPYTIEFIYSLCISASFQETFISLVTGTSSSHQRVKPEDLSNIEVVCPSDISLKEFTQKTQPMFVQIQANKEQSCTLASIRDALLPKLLSGEIRVNYIEKMTEATL